MTDHLDRAREYIAIAESDDAARTAWIGAADEIAAWLSEDTARTQRQASDALGKSAAYAGRLVRWRTNDYPGSGPFAAADGDRVAKGAVSEARRTMADPEHRRRVLDDLPTEHVEAIASAATETAVERARAARAEQQTEPTARELADGERFDPSEFWADTLIIRVNRNARELAALVKRAGGLLFGSMSPDEAHEYLAEAERLIADTRAAAQEQARDRAGAQS